MSAEPVRRTLSMNLQQLVGRYRSVAGEFSKPVSLFSFELSQVETERLFSSFDEDYHISRFFHFSEADGVKFLVNGVPVTHVSLDAAIATIL